MSEKIARASDEKTGVLLRSSKVLDFGQGRIACVVEGYNGFLPSSVQLELVTLLALVYPRRTWNKEIIQETFLSDERVKKVWVVYCQGQCVGVAAVQIKPEHGPYSFNVHWISVHPEFQRLGLGKRLIAELWKWAKVHGKITLYAHSTTFTPEVAAFYRDLGFKQI